MSPRATGAAVGSGPVPARARVRPTGRLALLLVATAGLVVLAGAALPRASRDLGAGVVLGAALLAAAWDAARVPRAGDLRVARLVRGPLRFGRPARVELAVDWRPRPGAARRAVRRVWWADLAPAALVAAAPLGRARLTAGQPLAAAYKVLPRARGPARWDGPVLGVDAPLGLWTLYVRTALSEEHTVYPGVRALERLPGRREQSGAPAAGEWGGVEPDGMRPYLPGEEARRIAWRASARRDEPLAVRLRPERGQRVLLMVDAGRWSAVSVAARPLATSRLDAFCAAALQVAAAALNAGDTVGLALLGDDGPAVVAPRGGNAALAELAGLLAAAVPGERDVDGVRATAAVRAAGPDVVLCFSEAPAPETAPDLFRRLPRLARRTRVAWCGVCPAEVSARASPAGNDGDGDRAAAVREAVAEMLRGRRRATATLARCGIVACDAAEHLLAAEAVALYRRLARGARAL